MSRVCVISGALLLVACNGSRERAFESAATQLNPVLLSMMPTVAVLEAATDVRSAAEACRELAPRLRQLESLSIASKDYKSLLDSTQAAYDGIRKQPSLASCLEDRGGRWDEVCAMSCLSRWVRLRGDFELLRQHARDYEVEIVSLRMGPTRQKTGCD